MAVEHGQWEQGEKLFRKAVATCPTNVEARRFYAEALWRRGAQTEAVEQLEAALDAEPNDLLLVVRTGEMYRTLGQMEKAQEMAERGLRVDSLSPAVWALRARVMQAVGQPQQAMSDMHRALSYARNDPNLLHELAEMYRQRGQPQRALTTLQQLAEIYPPGEEPQNVLYLTGLAYMELGRYEDASETLYAASRRGAPAAQILFNLGEAELLAGRPAAATANAQLALQVDPNHRPSHELLNRISQGPPGAGLRR